MARIVTDPQKPVIPPDFNPECAQSIISYISVAKLRKGILDGGGQYRFYILSDVERGALNHAPRSQCSTGGRPSSQIRSQEEPSGCGGKHQTP